MKSIVLYVVMLTGLAFALTGIMQAGQRLTPPQSVGGAWTLRAEPLERDRPSCLGLRLEDGEPALTIAQSGPDFVLTLEAGHTVPMTGTITGTRLEASAAVSPPVSAAMCPNSHVRLRADLVRRDSGPDQLSGMLTVDNCGGCAPLKIEATRVPKQTKP